MQRENIKNKIMFDFGENWIRYSIKTASRQKVKEATKDFKKLFKNIEIKKKSFLDIGFGQGLSLLIASALGAKVVGCEINKKCLLALKANQERFFPNTQNIPVIIGSILNKKTVIKLKNTNPAGEDKNFQIVHSWGVLHHTGNMFLALDNTSELVAKNGYLVISIYNRHWTSPFWWLIKYFYNKTGKYGKMIMINFFYVIILFSKFIFTGKNPFKLVSSKSNCNTL
jgi:2-polyprenyl-6-hydroxyphenyl methylase/3-demethylubiquinone-9 3-methyltransferase